MLSPFLAEENPTLITQGSTQICITLWAVLPYILWGYGYHWTGHWCLELLHYGKFSDFKFTDQKFTTGSCQLMEICLSFYPSVVYWGCAFSHLIHGASKRQPAGHISTSIPTQSRQSCAFTPLQWCCSVQYWFPHLDKHVE